MVTAFDAFAGTDQGRISPSGFTAVPISVASTVSLNAETYALTDQDILTIRIGGSTEQTVLFDTTDFSDITLATAAEVAAVIQAQIPPARIISGNAGPYALSDGFTLTVSINSRPNRTATFNTADFADIANALASEIATVLNADIPIPAQLDSPNVAPFTLSDGETLTLKVDGGGTQTATFNTADFADITNATAQEVVDVINADTTGLTASVLGNRIRLESDTGGSTSSLEVTGGTANTAFGFSTAVINGIGITASATSDGRIVIESEDTGVAASIEITGGTANAALGFDTAVVFGAPGVTASASGGNVLLQTVDKGDAATIEVTGGNANDELGFVTDVISGVSGSFVYCLGSDTSGRIMQLKPGDRHEVSQVNAFDTDTLLRLTARTRGAQSMPSGYRWRVSLRIDGSEYVSRVLEEGRKIRDLLDMGANLASFGAGDHTLAFRLELETTGPTDAVFVELPAFYVEALVFSAP